MIILILGSLTGCIVKVKNDTETVVNLYPAYIVEDNKQKWGYLDEDGEFQIEPKYDEASNFSSEGLAVVKLDGLSGVVNSKGEILAPLFQVISDFANGYFYAFDGKTNHIFDYTGKLQFFTDKYQYIGPYKDNLFVSFKLMDDNSFKAGYIDKLGMEAIKSTYEEAWDFYNGKALVKIETGKYEIIDVEGNTIKVLNNSVIASIKDSELLAFVENELTGIMDREGNLVAEPRFTSIIETIDNHIVVKEKVNEIELTGVIDFEGNVTIEPKYQNIKALGKGYFALQDMDSNKFALSNSKGELITDFIYFDMGNQLGKLSNNLVSVYDGEKTYAIDLKGESSTVIPELNGKGNVSFDGKVTKANINNRVSYFDKDGDLLWEQINSFTLSETAKVIEKTFIDGGLNINYPVVEGLKDKEIEDSINQRLYKEFVGDGVINKSKYKPYNTTYNVNSTNDLLIIDTFTDYVTNKELNSDRTGKIYNISLNKGTFYELKDLFNTGSNYIEILSNIILGQMEQGTSAGMYDLSDFKGIRFDQDFIPQTNIIDIYFMPGELSGSQGEFQKFSIEQSDIDDILDLNSEFWWTYLVKRGY